MLISYEYHENTILIPLVIFMQILGEETKPFSEPITGAALIANSTQYDARVQNGKLPADSREIFGNRETPVSF